MLCPTCGGRTDLSRDPYVCPTGIVSNEQCLHELEQVLLAKIETKEIEVPRGGIGVRVGKKKRPPSTAPTCGIEVPRVVALEQTTLRGAVHERG
jgi:hypothetical protein